MAVKPRNHFMRVSQ